ncbi:hypothetical protein VIS19158_13892 [Vibrio scophthalmi LMG 19158]|uniref:Uncharacterized protein n=1 Tax=Vibrio scophthalmi LMG 19158 TaxID=870967 RepID=F9RNQ2_9VIBR|nr:hypothetical protein VIS19158_13892 [Vibrio scophthalmi LMG 19158]
MALLYRFANHKGKALFYMQSTKNKWWGDTQIKRARVGVRAKSTNNGGVLFTQIRALLRKSMELNPKLTI